MMTKHGLEFMTMIIHPWLSEPTKQSYSLSTSFPHLLLPGDHISASLIICLPAHQKAVVTPITGNPLHLSNHKHSKAILDLNNLW